MAKVNTTKLENKSICFVTTETNIKNIHFDTMWNQHMAKKQPYIINFIIKYFVFSIYQKNNYRYILLYILFRIRTDQVEDKNTLLFVHPSPNTDATKNIHYYQIITNQPPGDLAAPSSIAMHQDQLRCTNKVYSYFK